MKGENQSWKVGLFVLITLIVLAGLMVNFSKGVGVFSPTYRIQVNAARVTGLQTGAAVRMSGVPIGQVEEIALAEGGKSVLIHLTIYERYKIHGDALFSIQQSGFLGDQYVEISPRENAAPVLEDGAQVSSDEPFNLEEAAKSAQRLIERVDKTVRDINSALTRIDETLLAEATLTNLTDTVKNFRQVSEKTLHVAGRLEDVSGKAVSGVDEIRLLISENRPTVGRSIDNFEEFSRQLQSVTNLAAFSGELTGLSRDLRGIVHSNRADITASISNLKSATESAREILSGLEHGSGVAGSLMQDERMQANLSLAVSNLTVLSSNLNRFGLLYKPKKPKNFSRTNRTSIYEGRTPFK